MQPTSSKALTKCFLEHQMVKPAIAVLAVSFIGLVGWVGIAHFSFASTELAAYTGKPVLGIQVIVPDELVARMFSFPPGEAVMVSQVVAKSPAERAGMQRGDGIVAIDGRSVRSPSDVATVLSQVKQGDLLRLTVIRGGLVHNVLLPLNSGG